MAHDTIMQNKLERFFSPCLTLYWKGRTGQKRDGWHVDRIGERPYLAQFMREAGLPTGNGVFVADKDIDKVLQTAGIHGYSLEMIGEPE